MPPNCIKYEELCNILDEYAQRDQDTKAKAIENKAKERSTWKRRGPPGGTTSQDAASARSPDGARGDAHGALRERESQFHRWQL